MAHQAGSAADLERLMEEYGTGLLRLCALHLGDAALAEDAAQETLLRAWRRYGTFRGEAAERTWITARPERDDRVHRPAGFDGDVHSSRGYPADTRESAVARDRKSTRLNSSHSAKSRMPSSA